MRKEHLVWLGIGILAYYLYLKFRFGLAGNPLSPSMGAAKGGGS